MKTKIILLILAFSLLLRLVNISSVPPSLTPDEAALGYNAYSILKTGRDEHGAFLPIIFKSFGDYKPGLYVYADVPFMALFGLNETSTRLPSVIAGTLAVLMLYLIIKELFKNEKLALFSAFFLSVMPWHIIFSRGAWEANLSLSLTLAGIYFFLKALKKPKYLFLAVLFFVLTTLAYQGAKLSSGIVVFLLVTIFYKKLLSIKSKYLVGSLIFGAIISLPILMSFFTGQTGRLTVFSVFSYPRPNDYLQNFLSESGVKKGSLVYDIFYSEPLNFARGILGRYFNHFSGRFLFFEGDWANPRHSAPYSGQLSLFDILPLIVGAVVLLKKLPKKEYLFIFLWGALAPLPAILSRDQVHAVRSLNLVVPLAVVLAFGANAIWRKFRKKKCILVVLVVVYAVCYSYFLDLYFIHLPKKDSKLWEYGYKQMVETITPIQNQYQRVVVQQSFAQPYIYFLFYQKYDPAKFQKDDNFIEGDNGDVGHVDTLDNICFCAIDWSIRRGDHGTLIAADTIRVPVEDSSSERQFNLIKEIDYLDGTPAFRILEIK